MNTTFSYYEILGIPPTATAAEIKTAYHAAILKYHPDVNTAPNAQRLTEIINDAYAVLSDEARRTAYDKSLASGQPMSEPGEEPDEQWDFFACDGCGKVDVHIRFAMFFRVWSIIFFTQMKGDGGVLCPECRSNMAISTALFSAFLGPWGFPWGIFYTLRSLFASLRSGEQPAQQNGQLLRHQGIAFLQRGFINEARTALTASLKFERNEGVTRLLNEPVFTVSTVYPAPGWSKGQTVAALLFAVPPVLLVLFFLMMGAGSETSSGGSYTPPASSTSQQSDSSSTQQGSGSTQQQSDDDAQFKAILSKCKSADDKNKDARTAYDACDQMLKQLADDMSGKSVMSEDYQLDSLYSDEMRLFKSSAASRLGWTNESNQLIQKANDDMKNLRTNGATPKVRDLAGKYYDCAVNGACGK